MPIASVLLENTARAMQGVSDRIVQLHIEHCRLADVAYGAVISEAVEKLANSNSRGENIS